MMTIADRRQDCQTIRIGQRVITLGSLFIGVPSEHVEIIRDQELEKFFTDHHVGSNAFLTQDGHSYQVNVGPWEIDIDINKEMDHYAIHVLLVFRLSNHRLHEFNINLPMKDGSVCKNFNVIGVIKATWCFIFENGSIFFSYDIQSVAGNWQHKIKLPYN